MKPLKSLLAVSLSAAMLFSAPVSGITGMEPQTVEAATKSCKLNRTSVTMNAGSSTRLTLSNAVSGKDCNDCPNLLRNASSAELTG